jgi:hypothetical protein
VASSRNLTTGTACLGSFCYMWSAWPSLTRANSLNRYCSRVSHQCRCTLCICHLHVAHWSGFGVRGSPLYPLFRNTKRLRESGNLPLSHPATPSLNLTPQFNIYKADLQACLVAHVLLAHHGYSESRRKTISCIFSKFIEPIVFKTFYPRSLLFRTHKEEEEDIR